VPPPLEQAVVVVTGASSGIGRLAALRFARRGCALALCARSGPVLEETAAKCEAAGGEGQEVNYGRSGRLLEILYAFAPRLYRRLAHRPFVRGTMSLAAVESTSGNVLAPIGPHTVNRPLRAEGLVGAEASTADGRPG
jgi:NAD(P)-dependent dehydrogenase (short-subunit alcohol dehydrogenase family)